MPATYNIDTKRPQDLHRGHPHDHPKPHPECLAVGGDVVCTERNPFLRILNASLPSNVLAQRFGFLGSSAQLDPGATNAYDAAPKPGHPHSGTVLPFITGASRRRTPVPQQAASSGGVTSSQSRPALRRNHAWYGNPKSSSASQLPSLSATQQTILHIHPLLAYRRFRRPPIAYDVTYTPSSRTILDRSTHRPVPAHTLAQPATTPPISTALTLTSHNLPWAVTASSPGAGAGSGTPVTVLDVLCALHAALSLRVTKQEWAALGHGGRAQRRATRAYERRCVRTGEGWDGGVRRIDFLGGKTRLVGVRIDKAAGAGAGKLVFGKA